MAEINSKEIVGDTFEDMSIVEMSRVQGSGDVEPDSLLSVSQMILSAAVSYGLSISVVKTVKGKC